MLIYNLPIDILTWISWFLPRTDQISLRLTNKFMCDNFVLTMSLDEELQLYTKIPDELDFAWKGYNSRIDLRTNRSSSGSKYKILNKYIVTYNLWQFDFNAEFNVYPGKYIVLFLTTVKNYTMNFKLEGLDRDIETWSLEPKNNKCTIDINKKGLLKVNCIENNSLKHCETVQYMMCIPEYYYKKLSGYEMLNKKGKKSNKIADWRKQITLRRNNQLLVENLETIIIRYF